MLLTKHDPCDEKVKWLEEDHQAFVVAMLRQRSVMFRVGMEGVRLTMGQAMKAKACGMERGEPDILVYKQRGIVLIELKKAGGTVHDAQKERFEKLSGLGHKVYVIKRKTPMESWLAVHDVLVMEGVL